MSRPPVTIVIPTFNRVEWLRGAIHSVLAQDYDDLELLVVDDGSTDVRPSYCASLFERHHHVPLSARSLRRTPGRRLRSTGAGTWRAGSSSATWPMTTC